jgi:hypothetical protein
MREAVIFIGVGDEHFGSCTRDSFQEHDDFDFVFEKLSSL